MPESEIKTAVWRRLNFLAAISEYYTEHENKVSATLRQDTFSQVGAATNHQPQQNGQYRTSFIAVHGNVS